MSFLHVQIQLKALQSLDTVKRAACLTVQVSEITLETKMLFLCRNSHFLCFFFKFSFYLRLYNLARLGSTLPLPHQVDLLCLFPMSPGPGGACFHSRQNIQSTRFRKLAFMLAQSVLNNNVPLRQVVKSGSFFSFGFACFQALLWENQQTTSIGLTQCFNFSFFSHNALAGGISQ